MSSQTENPSTNELHLILGGAGCIGSELAKVLLKQGKRVRAYDNLSSGRYAHVKPLLSEPGFQFVRGDVLDYEDLAAAMEHADMVWHLTAKTDIKFHDGYDFDADWEQNLVATWKVLRAMRHRKVKRLAFASSAAVYGEATYLDETAVLPEPVSFYGATKLSCEALIRAFALRTGMQAWMFRYCSIVSGKARNGGNMVVPDFIHKLQKCHSQLQILGDGNQSKPSLLVSECVDGMLFAIANDPGPVALYNVGVSDAISVTRQAELVSEAMGLQPEFHYTGGPVGWPGDVASFRMCTAKLSRLGWTARRSSEEAVKAAIQGLLESGE